MTVQGTCRDCGATYDVQTESLEDHDYDCVLRIADRKESEEVPYR